MKRILILLSITFITIDVYAQLPFRLDSLLTVLKTATEDTSKANTLNALSRENIFIGDYSEARKYIEEALLLSQKIGFKRGMARSYQLLGLLYYYLSDYSKALEVYQSSLSIYKQLGSKENIASVLSNIGIIYYALADYPKALEYYQKSLSIQEHLTNKKGNASNLNNIGNIYYESSDYSKAIQYYQKALTIFEQLDDKHGLAQSLSNIGNIYYILSDPKALEYFQKALAINEQLGDKFSIARNCGNIGKVYSSLSNYIKALEYYYKALKIEEELGDKSGIADSHIKIGEVYEKQKNHIQALRHEKIGLLIALQIGSRNLIKDAYQNLTIIDSAMNNFKGAFENHKLYRQVYDSIFNGEVDRKLVKMQLNYEYDKRSDSTKAEQMKVDALKEITNQKNIRNYVLGGLLVVVFFLIILFIQRNRLAKQKTNIQEEKNRSEELLLNILPTKVAEELKLRGHADTKTYGMVTVMFIDFKDFTLISKQVSPELLVAELDYCFSAFDLIMEKYRLEKIKTIGDAYMCVGGLPVLTYTHTLDIISAAFEIIDFMSVRKNEKTIKNEPHYEARIGVHTGPVVAGIVGLKKYAFDIWGETVNVASRMEKNSEAGKINISGKTYDLIKNNFNCTKREMIYIKNIGEVDMYFVNPTS